MENRIIIKTYVQYYHVLMYIHVTMLLQSLSLSLSGDHKLSYREFIAIMKGWKLRGYKVCIK